MEGLFSLVEIIILLVLAAFIVTSHCLPLVEIQLGSGLGLEQLSFSAESVGELTVLLLVIKSRQQIGNCQTRYLWKYHQY